MHSHGHGIRCRLYLCGAASADAPAVSSPPWLRRETEQVGMKAAARMPMPMTRLRVGPHRVANHSVIQSCPAIETRPEMTNSAVTNAVSEESSTSRRACRGSAR